MVIYILMAIVLMFFSNYKKQDPLFLVLILIVLASIRALSVGIDHLGFYLAYKYEISIFSLKDLTTKFEIGWILVNKAIKLLFDDFSYVLWLASFLTLGPIYIAIKKEDKLPAFALFLYFTLFYYCLSLSLIRQSIAMAFFILSLSYYKKDKMVSFCICMISAFVFHYSAIILLPLVLICNRFELSYRTVVLTVSITFVAGYLGLTDALRNIIQLLPFEKYSHYADYKQDVVLDRFNVYMFLVPKNILFLVAYKLIRSEFKVPKNIYFCGLVISNLFISISLVSRFVLYTSIVEIILIPGVIYYAKGNDKVYYKLIAFGYAFVYFIYYLSINRGGVVPYEI